MRNNLRKKKLLCGTFILMFFLTLQYFSMYKKCSILKLICAEKIQRKHSCLVLHWIRSQIIVTDWRAVENLVVVVEYMLLTPSVVLLVLDHLHALQSHNVTVSIWANWFQFSCSLLANMLNPISQWNFAKQICKKFSPHLPSGSSTVPTKTLK